MLEEPVMQGVATYPKSRILYTENPELELGASNSLSSALFYYDTFYP